MVQVIQAAGPSEATLRQQALNQGLQQAIEGVKAYGQAQATQRQQALAQQAQDINLAMKLQSMGTTASPEDVKAYAAGTYRPKEITPAIPAQEAIPASFKDDLSEFAKTPQSLADLQAMQEGRIPQIFSEGKEAVPAVAAVMGPSNPLMSYTPQKQAEIAAAKELQQSVIAKNLASSLIIPMQEQKLIAEISKLEQDASLTPERRKLLVADIVKRASEAKLTEAKIGEVVAKTKKFNRTGAGFGKPPKNALEKLSAEARGKVGSVVSGLSALDDMQKAISQGFEPQYIDVNTPLVGSFMSDTPFTQSQRVVSEVVGRLQSGGAISAGEMKNFNNMGPRPGDTPEMVKSKINAQKNFLENKLTSFGLKEEELTGLGYNKAKSTAPTQSAGSPWAKFGGK